MLSRLGVPHLLVASSLLMSFGLVMVYSASAIHADLQFGRSSVYLLRQASGVVLGIGFAVLLSRIPLHVLARIGLPCWLGCCLLVAATLTPLGVGNKGAERWLSVGGFVFQPLEPMKLGLVLGLAQWLGANERRLDDWRASLLGPSVLVAVPGALLLCQPDYGGAVLLCLFAAAMVFVAGAPARQLILTGLAVLPLAAFVALQRDYRRFRLQAFLDPWSDAQGHGYQLVQSLLSFGAGGTAGTGLGSGQQKLGYLPEAHTDFILSVVGEELGLLGVGFVLVCFALLGMAALAVASRGRNAFAVQVAFGAGLLLWLQGLLNAGVALGLLPTKGTTLPLFSYGRSSMIVSIAAIGLILNVGRPAKRGRAGWR